LHLKYALLELSSFRLCVSKIVTVHIPEESTGVLVLALALALVSSRSALAHPWGDVTGPLFLVGKLFLIPQARLFSGQTSAEARTDGCPGEPLVHLDRCPVSRTEALVSSNVVLHPMGTNMDVG